MNKKVLKIIIPLLTLALVASGILYVIKKRDKDIEVKTQKVLKGDITSLVNTTGVIKSKEHKEYFSAQQKVTKINVKVGDEVKKGDVLIEFDNGDLNNSLNQAQLQYDNAVLQKKELENQVGLYDSKIKDTENKINSLEDKKKQLVEGTMGKEDLVKKEIEGITMQIEQLKREKAAIQPISKEKVKLAENQVDMGKSSLEATKSKLDSLGGSIIAEFQGIITEINASVGGVTNPAAPTLILENINSLKLSLSLSKSEAEKIKKDQRAIIHGKDKNYHGEVSFISPTAKKIKSLNGEDTYVETEVEFLDNPENIKINFDMDADIVTGEKKDVLLIPTEALKMEKDEKYVVYILNDEIIEERAVQVGIQSELNIEILSGVNEGEKVVLNPNSSIKNGVKVKEKN
ncbi:efflux RND transporter periplasmic adaptor subunit [Clostridium hydrogeniformans]|uniref:efflux RND transporter periplasmic adaptor subunit n=1 Tax=Clostridium hydrogeniformans TaxID=349933 RepID=UPI00048A39D9|nr:efflux RND transporter periplasmic adaptor subunit [Clostridium hydrogeniformans]